MTEERIRVRPAPRVGEVKEYCPPSSPTPVDLHLSSNEGRPPPAELLQAVMDGGPELLCSYPDAGALERQIARRCGVESSRVLVTAGADDALERVMRAVLAPGREMVHTVPTFEMMDRYARLNGATLIEIPWLEGEYPLDEVLSRITERTALVSVVTPASPSGQVVDFDILETLSRRAPHALLLADLAYVDFADEDPTSRLLELPNAVVARSLSKAWGLAGLRVGYALGPAEVLGWLRVVGHPYAVSNPSLRLAGSRLAEGQTDVDRFVARIREERARLSEFLTTRGVNVLPSQGNYLLGRVPDEAWLRDALAGLAIAVRVFPDRPLLKGWARITLPGEEALFDRLVRALEVVLRPEALLFDMDDTLADTTESYRRATLATLESYGVAAASEDVTRAKQAGNATNDWIMTQRMLADGGVEASLSEVTERFEAFYQGTPEAPGFRSAETLLCERAVLERLAKRYRLGVVTGRPREDALAFLEGQSIAHLFDALVTMHEAPAKPDPAPVRLALERLGVQRAWMVGDTPDDMRAARGCGVLPIGVIAPPDDPEVARPALLQAGAGRVLENAAQLEEVLP